jgi:hypothetical protein
VPNKIDKIEVNLDFHIYPILDLDLLLGNPSERLHVEDLSQGSLDKKLRESPSTTTSSYLENPMMKPFPEQNPLEEVMHIPPFTSSEPVPNKGTEPSTSKEESSWAMKFLEALTLESEQGSFILETRQEPRSQNISPESATLCATSTFRDYNHTLVLICKMFGRLVVDTFVYHKHCKFRGCSVALSLQLRQQ